MLILVFVKYDFEFDFFVLYVKIVVMYIDIYLYEIFLMFYVLLFNCYLN